MSIRKFFRKAFWYKPITFSFNRRKARGVGMSRKLIISFYPFRNPFPDGLFKGLRFGFFKDVDRDPIVIYHFLGIYVGTMFFYITWQQVWR